MEVSGAMVVTTMARRNGTSRYHHFFYDKPPPATLGILAFDAAKTMCRLISLYKSLTDDEISRLRMEVMKSKGVVYLNSKDECFLTNLACAERLEDLNMAAVTVSRLGRKCSDFGLHGFDLVYADLKLGLIDLGKLEFRNRNIQKIIEKMEKLVSATGNLHNAMESLTEMEASEKRVQRWKTIGIHHGAKPNMEYFNDRMKYQKKQVQHYKEVSLWNQTFDKAVGLMARIVCIVYARICSVFAPYMTDLTCFNKKNIRSKFSRKHFDDCGCCIQDWELNRTDRRHIEGKDNATKKGGSKSGPIPKTNKTPVVLTCKSPLSTGIGGGIDGIMDCKELCSYFNGEVAKNNRVFKMAQPSTVGGSGLSLRYANVILFAERCLHAPATIGEDAREALYNMLPRRLKGEVRRKLKRHWTNGGNESLEEEDGHWLAEGWREAVEEMMEWLSPVAHDTVKWQAERNLEKQRLDTKPTVLLLQTLHYSDLEKAEAAIVEVLVGLSCIYWYEPLSCHIGREPWCNRNFEP